MNDYNKTIKLVEESELEFLKNELKQFVQKIEWFQNKDNLHYKQEYIRENHIQEELVYIYKGLEYLLDEWSVEDRDDEYYKKYDLNMKDRILATHYTNTIFKHFEENIKLPKDCFLSKKLANVNELNSHNSIIVNYILKKNISYSGEPSIIDLGIYVDNKELKIVVRLRGTYYCVNFYELDIPNRNKLTNIIGTEYPKFNNIDECLKYVQELLNEFIPLNDIEYKNQVKEEETNNE